MGIFSKIFGNNNSDSSDVFERQCANGDATACNFLGHQYDHGLGTNKNYAKAIKYFKKSCDLNNGEGCYNLAGFYQFGDGTWKNYTKAMKYFKKACDVKYESGCKEYEKLKKELNKS